MSQIGYPTSVHDLSTPLRLSHFVHRDATLAGDGGRREIDWLSPQNHRVKGCIFPEVQKLRSAVVSLLPRPVVSRLRTVKRSLMRHWIDETDIVASLASSHPPVAGALLVDVGAANGSVTTTFLDMGWFVVAYEPDPANRKQFERHIGSHPRVQLSDSAVSDKPAESVTLYTSPVSAGVSTLAAFHESHEPSATVTVVTLADDLHARGVERVDFLKIDIEGFDYFALRGFDWSYEPRFVLYEFEDRKTVPLGYSLADSSKYVADLGYHLVFSVWEPIVEYGSRHQWRGLFTTPPSDFAECWGNVLCFRDDADAVRCMERFGQKR